MRCPGQFEIFLPEGSAGIKRRALVDIFFSAAALRQSKAVELKRR